MLLSTRQDGLSVRHAEEAVRLLDEEARHLLEEEARETGFAVAFPDRQLEEAVRLPYCVYLCSSQVPACFTPPRAIKFPCTAAVWTCMSSSQCILP